MTNGRDSRPGRSNFSAQLRRSAPARTTTVATATTAVTTARAVAARAALGRPGLARARDAFFGGFALFTLGQGQELAAGQADLAVALDADHFDVDLFAFFEHVTRRLDAFMRDFRHVQERFVVRQDLDERAEVDQALHDAVIDAAHFRLGREAFDDGQRALDGFGVRARNRHRAVVFDVHRAARLVDDAFDRLAARADDDADLVRLDLDRRDARSMTIDLGAGRRQRVEHAAQDVNAAFACLLQRLLHHVAAEAGDLDVHLDGGDALLGAGGLVVHDTEVIFVTQDVAQDGEPGALCDQTHGDTGHRATQRNTAVHQAERSAAHRGHRARAVRLEDLADDADRVRELVVRRDQALHGAFGERAVTHFTTTRTTHRLGFAGAEGREVVVKHEALPRFTGERVDLLLVGRGAQGGGDDGLRLAALEQRRAVHAGQEPHFAADRTDGLAIATVDALAGVEHHRAHDLCLAMFDLALDQLFGGQERFRAQLGGELLDDRLLDHGVLLVALLLLFDHAGRAEIGVGELRHALGDARVERGRDELALRLADGGTHLLDQRENRLSLLVREEQRVDQLLLAALVRAAFDHHDRVFADGDRDIEIGCGGLLERRVDDQLAVDARHADADDRAGPRDVGDVQRRTGAGHGQHVGGVHLVRAEHGGDDLGVLLEALGKQGSQRAIHQARGQHFVVTKTPLTLEKASRDFARGVRLFDVFTGQRKEVEARALFTRHAGDEHDALTEGDEHCAVRQLGQATGLEREQTTADIYGFANKHGFSAPWRMGAAACGKRRKRAPKLQPRFLARMLTLPSQGKKAACGPRSEVEGEADRDRKM